ncbi:hypothetical protein WJM97_09905 [Okeanomitos corallinicola TIOX110]|uniref:Uncharacterized protein n=1 Tax=Okeanomitos corallinicola TIOX110 TaxID=3133117 RepID=A0ABZ2V0E4_9CYAN
MVGICVFRFINDYIKSSNSSGLTPNSRNFLADYTCATITSILNPDFSQEEKIIDEKPQQVAFI